MTAERPEAIENALSTRLEDGESGHQFARRYAGAAALGIEHMVVGHSSLLARHKARQRHA
jgi:hypothetical protein